MLSVSLYQIVIVLQSAASVHSRHMPICNGEVVMELGTVHGAALCCMQKA